jgi:hypothetical protein
MLLRTGFLLRFQCPVPLANGIRFYSLPELDRHYLAQDPQIYMRHLANDAQRINSMGKNVFSGPEKYRAPGRVYSDWPGRPNKLVALSGVLEKGAR